VEVKSLSGELGRLSQASRRAEARAVAVAITLATFSVVLIGRGLAAQVVMPAGVVVAFLLALGRFLASRACHCTRQPLRWSSPKMSIVIPAYASFLLQQVGTRQPTIFAGAPSWSFLAFAGAIDQPVLDPNRAPCIDIDR
jgi:hypothetical protein